MFAAEDAGAPALEWCVQDQLQPPASGGGERPHRSAQPTGSALYFEPDAGRSLSGHAPAVGDPVDQVEPIARLRVLRRNGQTGLETGAEVADGNPHPTVVDREPERDRVCRAHLCVANAVRHELAHQQAHVLSDPAGQAAAVGIRGLASGLRRARPAGDLVGGNRHEAPSQTVAVWRNIEDKPMRSVRAP
jgi:hypothetical protein